MQVIQFCKWTTTMSNDIQFIQRYYQFDLSEEELNDFKNRMDSDEAFADLVLQYHSSQKTAADFYQSEEDQNRTANWESVIKGETPSEIKKPTGFSYPWRIAATLLALIGISSLLFIVTGNDTDRWENLAEEAKEMSPKVEFLAMRGQDAENKEKTLVSDAYALYLSGEYPSAIKLFNKVADGSEYYSDAIFFTALSYYQEKKYDQFFSLLDSTEHNTTPKLQQQLLWYKGLIYLEQQEIDKASNIFEDLSTADSELGNNSKGILQKIKASDK